MIDARMELNQPGLTGFQPCSDVVRRLREPSLQAKGVVATSGTDTAFGLIENWTEDSVNGLEGFGSVGRQLLKERGGAFGKLQVSIQDISNASPRPCSLRCSRNSL